MDQKNHNIDLEKLVATCNEQAKKFPPIKKYLNDRLINDDIIDIFKIGYGMFWQKRWIVIPVLSYEKKVLYLKLRKDPNDKSNRRKYIYYPENTKASIYGSEDILNNEVLMITEGEFDRLVAISKGIPAITSTSGVTGFKRDWFKRDETGIGIFNEVKKIYICFDSDKPGMVNSGKLADAILEETDRTDVFLVTLPAMVNGKPMPESGDLTDYFMLGGGIDDLFEKYTLPCKKKIKENLEPIEQPKMELSGNGEQITASDIEAAKNADITHLVSDITKRDPDGKAWLCCPFHNDKTPSCVIYPNGGGWCCYAGCGAGDYIDFIEKYHKVEFKEAVRLILGKK